MKLVSFLVLILVMGCGEAVTGAPEARVLLLGDSMMAANRGSGGSVAEVIETELGQPVIDRAVVGARYFYALPISGSAGLRLDAQYRAGDWQWVVLNGGGNDLVFGCGCGKCDGVLDRLISVDGRQGEIPGFVARLRASGARVIYTGYLRNPGTATPVKACKPAGDELDRRLAIMAGLDPGMLFVSLADLVPYGDTSFHAPDRVHPSIKGSRAIGQRIVAAMAP